MVDAITTSGINPIQMFNAVNAFKANEQVQNNNANFSEPSEGLEINDMSILDNQNLTEIREFAKIVGEDNLSNDDIQYGLTYGRSVIADYMI